jgi:ABC-type branched-subunit amino acid transport system ATPase component
MTALLEVAAVSKHYGGIVANNHVTLSVPEGGIVGLIGPNGSGKTTLFNSIAGTHPIDEGSIRFDGREISDLRVPEIARLGLVRTFQQTRVFRQMSCVDNMLVSVPQQDAGLAVMIARPAHEERVRAGELLEFVGLAGKRDLPAGSLSFGQQKLLEFAMALMNQPRLLLLDEPTAGINPTFINGLVDRLKRARDNLGITLLIIEHNMRVVMNLAEHIYCLAHGEILAEGPPAEIQNDPRVVAAYLGVG